MKKKVALLLAVVMVLSMLPLSVFGAARPGSVANPRLTPMGSGSDDYQSYNFHVDAAAFSNLTEANPTVLDIRLSGAGDGDVRFSGYPNIPTIRFEAGPGFSMTSGGAIIVDPVAVQAELDRLSARATLAGYATRINHQRISVDMTAGIPYDADAPSFDGFFTIVIGGNQPVGTLGITDGIRINSGNARIDMALVSGGGILGQATVNLLSGSLTGDWMRGVTITSTGMANMGSVAHLQGIRITENAPGRLVAIDSATSSFMVRLVAPRGFVWDANIRYRIENQPLRVSTGSFISSANVRVLGAGAAGAPAHPGLDDVNIEGGILRNNVTDRSEIYLYISDLVRTNSTLARMENAQITIENLSLVPIAGAATTGNL